MPRTNKATKYAIQIIPLVPFHSILFFFKSTPPTVYSIETTLCFSSAIGAAHCDELLRSESLSLFWEELAKARYKESRGGCWRIAL